MSKKWVVLVGVLMLISVLAFVGATYAQGPRNDPGGRGQGHRVNQTNMEYMRNIHEMRNVESSALGMGSRHANRNNEGDCIFGDYEANLPPATPGELPDEVVAAITAGLQDEHNAYNTYDAIIEQFGEVRPFEIIREAEARHIEALEFIFTRYDVPIPEPVALESVPAFDSLNDACQAGEDAEIANFGLYDEWLATVSDYPDIVQVFTALRDASEFNHLPAFENCSP